MKKWIALVLGLGVAAALTAFLSTFTAAKLDVLPLAAGSLPTASPPAEMTLSALPTGAMESKAMFAYRGGAWGDVRQFTMTTFLIRHPKGDVLIDAGFGNNVDEHVKSLPWIAQKLTTYSKGTPAALQLAANGIRPDRLAGVILTHAHWDHVSGLDGFEGVPLWVDAAEGLFISKRTRNTELLNSFLNINYKVYDFDGGPYLGFPRSHDVFGDGSVVIVPSPGHTPGSVVIFVSLPSGARYAFLGDLVWQNEGFEIPAERPWMLRRMIGENDAEVRENVGRIAAIHQRFPEMKMVPAHDARAAAGIPVFPSSMH